MALTLFDEAVAAKKVPAAQKRALIERMDAVMGFDLFARRREDLRLRPKRASATEDAIDEALARRKEARAAKDFAASDAIRDALAAQGVEVMDGDPLGWEWTLDRG